jgi:hypothetical protein
MLWIIVLFLFFSSIRSAALHDYAAHRWLAR